MQPVLDRKGANNYDKNKQNTRFFIACPENNQSALPVCGRRITEILQGMFRQTICFWQLSKYHINDTIDTGT
jgi:hypothetical protein